ncbi:hypothetical protein BJY00DRAFT_279157 [Aspergillus carlsbadensis]|nr:hypothetical protein BJY00DRAFT_279157 [Aspergillus carlsbadensis]
MRRSNSRPFCMYSPVLLLLLLLLFSVSSACGFKSSSCREEEIHFGAQGGFYSSHVDCGWAQQHRASRINMCSPPT